MELVAGVIRGGFVLVELDRGAVVSGLGVSGGCGTASGGVGWEAAHREGL
jgi:uncharacterized protein GlcG (DUF336 family)